MALKAFQFAVAVTQQLGTLFCCQFRDGLELIQRAFVALLRLALPSFVFNLGLLKSVFQGYILRLQRTEALTSFDLGLCQRSNLGVELVVLVCADFDLRVRV